MADFTGKVVIVTGAGTGIGAAAARRFATDGASVVLAGRRADKLQELADTLPKDRVLVQVTDVAKEADCNALVEATVARFGQLDVLVNNAGTAAFGPFEKTEIAEYHRVMQTNVDGVIYCIRAALPHLLKNPRQHRQRLIRVRPGRRLGPQLLQRVQGRGHQPHPRAGA